MSVTIVVHPGAAGVPTGLGSRLDEASALGDVEEGPVTVVVIEDVLSIVGNEQIVVAIVVIIADATGLPPTSAEFQARAFSDIGERAVAIVFKETTMRLMVFGESFEPPAIYEKDIQPAIVVIVIKSEAAAGGFEKIFIFFHAAVNSFDIKARTFDDIHEADAQRRPFYRRLRAGRRRSGLGVITALGRTNLLFRRNILLRGERHKIRKGKHQSRAAQRTKKFAPIRIQNASSVIFDHCRRRRCYRRSSWRRQVSCRCECARARFQWKAPDACEENRGNRWVPRDRSSWWRKARPARRPCLSCLCGDTGWRGCSARPRRQDR